MSIAVLALAMVFGGIAAATALILGWSLLAAFAIYSGCGLIGVLAITLSVAAMSALHSRKSDLVQTGAVAGS